MRSSILTQKRARGLRRAMTPPEVALWVKLRARLPGRPVFRRQHALGPYILDFFCPRARLAIEVDGGGHGEPGQIAHDARRDAWLGEQGVTVYRVTAGSVMKDSNEAANAVIRLAVLLAGKAR